MYLKKFDAFLLLKEDRLKSSSNRPFRKNSGGNAEISFDVVKPRKQNFLFPEATLKNCPNSLVVTSLLPLCPLRPEKAFSNSSIHSNKEIQLPQF